MTESYRSRDARPAAAASPAPLPLRYFAFLSYSHQDEGIARWLHDALERFRVPAGLVGQTGENGTIPARLSPIFRDRHELAASQDLGSEINEALATSRFLIVLCSPAAANSRWTNAEVERFKRLRPEGCILAAIIAGEPFASDLPGREAEECLPPALRLRYDRRGRSTGKRAEPLAADLREGGDGRRLGLLKIVAGLLGVGLDDLVQREALRRQRRLAWTAAASLTGMIVASSLAIAALQARDAARDQRREAESLVGFMLGDLRTKLEPLGRLDVLDSVGARALRYYQGQDKGSLSDDALAQRSRALTLMGEIANKRGDLDGALRLYREAFAGTAEALRRDSDDPQRLFDHAQNVFWVGYIDWQRGRLAEAERAFRAYKGLARRLLAIDPDKPEWRLESKYADTNLGTVLMQQHRFEEAAQVFELSLATAEALAANEPNNAAYQGALIEALAWLAGARASEGRLEEALAQRERQLALLQLLRTSHPDDTELSRKALTAHRAMSRLLAYRGDLDGSRDHARRAVRHADALVRTEPGNTEWLESSARARLDLGSVLRLARDYGEAGAAVRAGCDTGSRLIARDRTVRTWNVDLRLICLSERARLALATGAPLEASSLASVAVAVAEGPHGTTGAEALIARAKAHQLAGDAFAAIGKPEAALRSWRRAAAIWPRNAALVPSDLATHAALMRSVGDLSVARRSEARLDAMGYRHPDYLRSRNRAA